jgi:D-alanyl-D-alanine carboxypeptidase
LGGLVGCSSDGSDDSDGSVDDPSLPPELQADLEAILDDAVANGAAPGVVLHVSQGDGARWSGAAGLAALPDGAAMAPELRFRAGSMVKTFVATAVLQALEAGKLELDDLLTDHLPVEVTDRIENADAIRIDMMLGHRSGIADWVTPAVKQVVVADPEHIWTLDEILDVVAEQPTEFPPGEQYGYSNTNYNLLGEILTAVSGRSWREEIRASVLEPSGLEDTSLPEPGDPECPPPCAHGYVELDGELMDLTRVDPTMAGASGGHALMTTSADLARFLERLRTGDLFELASSREAMFAFQPAVNAPERLVGYGLGVMQMESNGARVIGHLGTAAGYRGFMLYAPATDRTITGFINVMGDIGPVLEPIVARLAMP